MEEKNVAFSNQETFIIVEDIKNLMETDILGSIEKTPFTVMECYIILMATNVWAL